MAKIIKELGGFKLYYIAKSYPRLYGIRGIYLNIYMCASPTANCQTASIGNAFQIQEPNLTKNDIANILFLIQHASGKSQLIIDLENVHNENVLRALKYFTKKKYSKKYTSTNRSIMHMHIIQLNLNKINKLRNH